MSSTIIKTVLDLLDSGDFYSGHQKARTSATRLLSKSTTPTPSEGETGVELSELDSKSKESIELLWLSSKKLLQLNQIGSGADLSLFLIQTYSNKNLKCGEEERSRILQLIALIGSSGSWRKSFTDAVFTYVTFVIFAYTSILLTPISLIDGQLKLDQVLLEIQ